MIEISGRIILSNLSDENIQISQVNVPKAIITLNPRQTKAFYFWGKKNPELLSVRLGDRFSWSGGFSVNNIDTFKVKTLNLDDKSVHYIGIHISQKYGSMLVTILPDKSPPYIIENKTSFPLSFAQKVTLFSQLTYFFLPSFPFQ